MVKMDNTNNAIMLSQIFPEDALVIFIGHSDDANEEAEAIRDLHPELERTFREYLDLPGVQSKFQSLRLWEWNKDAFSKAGGQKKVIDPVLYQARIALFVFKERVGAITWEVLEKAREQSLKDNLHILTFFPGKVPQSLDMTDVKTAEDWSCLMRRKVALTEDWNEDGSRSLTPFPNYEDRAHLKKIALERLSKAIHGILCEGSHTVKRQSVRIYAELEQSYQSTLEAELGKIRLIGAPHIDSIQVNLDDTFVPLRISHSRKTDDRFKAKHVELPPQENMDHHTPDELMRRVLPQYRMLLVIGDPGSGKTTLMKYYALCCLQSRQERLFIDPGPVKVFYLPLRDLKAAADGEYLALPEQLSLWAKQRSNSIDTTVFEGWLRTDDSKSLVLLDGLDEISDLEQRKEACHRGTSRRLSTHDLLRGGTERPRGGPYCLLASDHIRQSPKLVGSRCLYRCIMP